MDDWTLFSEAARPFWLVWLVAMYIGIVFWALRPGNKARFDKDALIVFKDEGNGG